MTFFITALSVEQDLTFEKKILSIGLQAILKISKITFFKIPKRNKLRQSIVFL
jgi:hypothetical protein